MIKLFPHYSLEISKKEKTHLFLFAFYYKKEEMEGGREGGKGSSKLRKNLGSEWLLSLREGFLLIGVHSGLFKHQNTAFCVL